ncbi:MAG: GTPase Era [Gemmatimonadota bacterium]
MNPPATRAGYVTLVGRPNAGKSTLLNALVGEKLSIVTSKAQTTWQRVTGISTSATAQLIFLDTPGLLEVKDLLQRSMLAAALEALHEADVVLLVLDASDHWSNSNRRFIEGTLSKRGSVPVVAAINKVDLAKADAVRELSDWVEKGLGGRAFPVTALTGEGIEPMRETLEELLPESPFLLPADEIATEPVRFFVAELVRETIFERYHQEIPYAVFCQVEEFRENEDPVYIQVTAYVERNSQKRILIGAKGAAIRELGREARIKIESFIGQRVYLDLWVKVLPGWRKRRADLQRLGFDVPGENEATTS